MITYSGIEKSSLVTVSDSLVITFHANTCNWTSNEVVEEFCKIARNIHRHTQKKNTQHLHLWKPLVPSCFTVPWPSRDYLRKNKLQHWCMRWWRSMSLPFSGVTHAFVIFSFLDHCESPALEGNATSGCSLNGADGLWVKKIELR